MINRILLCASFSAIPLVLPSNVVFAGDLPWLNLNQVELSAGLGAAKQRLGNATFGVTETETDNLAQSDNPMIGELDVGIAYRLSFKEQMPAINWLPNSRISLNYRHMSNRLWDNPAEGQIEQYQDPRMANYTYQLALTQDRLMADLSFNLIEGQRSAFFVMGGIGYGWNKLAYVDYPNAGVDVGNLFLADKHTNKFTTEVGVGANYQLTGNTKLYLQYLYSYFGHVSTASYGVLDGTPATIAPATFTVDYNAVLVGLTFALS